MWENDKQKYVCVCGLAKKEILYLDFRVDAKLNALLNEYKNLEWYAFLIGDCNFISDILLVEQEVSSCSVHNIFPDANIKTYGVVHSHHGLGIHDFSINDKETLNKNHEISILVWHGGRKAVKRVKLSCGAYTHVDLDIEIVYPHVDTTQFIEDAKSKIKIRRYENTPEDHDFGKSEDDDDYDYFFDERSNDEIEKQFIRIEKSFLRSLNK
jgi:hypothetical protein